MPLESIRHLIKDDLEFVDRHIIAQLDSHIPMIKDIIGYVLTCGGKRIRPLLLLLSSKALATNRKNHIDLAAVIELIHTATLLHDDVVDGSNLRRGHRTAHMIWGSDASVLVGDFLYSRAFQIVVNLKQERILDIFAKATHYIAEGEIMQLVNCHNAETTEAFYFEIIHRKTAKLFEIASQLGAMTASTDEISVEALKKYGMHLGMAYQLIDDALDYSDQTGETGKNIGQDIADGKATLPLIYAMSKSKGADLKLLRRAIEKGETKDLKNILEIIHSTSAINYTATTAKKHAVIAKEALTTVPENPYASALGTLADFVVERNY